MTTRGKSSLVSILVSLFTWAQVYPQGIVPLNTSSTYLLDSGWHFVPDQLLSPEQLRSDSVKGIPIRVPGGWIDSNHESTAMGTYTLGIEHVQKLVNSSIHFPQIHSAAKIWLNGNLVDELGICDADPAKYRGASGSLLIPIPDNTSAIELVIQVVDYDYSRGGITISPVIGPTSSLLHEINTQKGIENFFTGSLIAMFIYQISLFALFQRGKPYLYIALICLFVALRAMITPRGSYFLPELFPHVSVPVWRKLEFFVVYAITAAFPLYIYSLFPAHWNKKVLQFFVLTGILLCSVVLLTPHRVYGQFLNVFHLVLIAGFLYSIAVISRAWTKENPEAHIILYGILASFPFILLEIIQNSRIINLGFSFPYLVEIGVLVFLLFQVYLLANQFANAYKNLETVNVDLEAKVRARTAELTKENFVRERLLSVVSHDIKSPLNSLYGLLSIYHQGALSGDEMKTFMSRISDHLASTTNMVDNILLWVTNQLKGVKVSHSSVDLFDLVEEHFRIFNTIAGNKKIVLVNDGVPIRVKTDRQILSFVLRNLIANALKFSYEGGIIKISYEREATGFKFIVADNGKGMHEESVSSLFLVRSSVSTAGTSNEKGNGLGLSLCYDYLKYINGEISVQSALEKGTTFTVRVPEPNATPKSP